MAFYKNPIIEEQSECIICGVQMGYSLELICSGTCEDLYDLGLHRKEREDDCYA